MPDGPAAAPPRRGETVATYVLLAAHGVLALLTIVAAASFMSQDDYMQSRCRSHGFDCLNPGLTAADWIAIGLSVALLIVDVVLVRRQRRKRQLSFFVPMLFGIAQFIVLWTLGGINHSW